MNQKTEIEPEKKAFLCVCHKCQTTIKNCSECPSEANKPNKSNECLGHQYHKKCLSDEELADLTDYVE